LGLIEDNQLVVMKSRNRFYPSPSFTHNLPALAGISVTFL
jgi:hypothetical protein